MSKGNATFDVDGQGAKMGPCLTTQSRLAESSLFVFGAQLEYNRKQNDLI